MVEPIKGYVVGMKNYAISAAYMCKQDSMGRMEAHAEVLKKTGQEMLTAKAYNGRCVLSWLAHCLLAAVDVHAGDDLLVLESSCLTLGFIYQPVDVTNNI